MGNLFVVFGKYDYFAINRVLIMKFYVFRNYTVEPFFKGMDVVFSGYEDVSSFNEHVDRYIWMYFPSFKLEEEVVVAEIDNYTRMLEWLLTRTNKLLLALTMPNVFEVKFQTSTRKLADAIEKYNEKLRALTTRYPHLRVLDILDFLQRYGNVNWIDWKFYFISQIPLNPRLAKDFNVWFQRQVDMIELKRKKCIVLDLDNTLWGGVLGEDGERGIKIGEGYPGNTYRFFQQYLLELRRNGVILTVCSKNNESDVLTIWEKHPEMILRKEHFTTYRINWNNKADNIRELAVELNIGLDSIVFVDDNPTERELVKQMLPEVSVPDFPDQPYLFPVFAKELTDSYFKVYSLTPEDIAKSQQYRENAERVRFEKQFVDFDSYLKSLDIELTIEPMDEFNVVRMAQMTQKTNQFNLTTHRYTETDIREFVRNGARVWGLRVSDRFGDNGLTGLIIVTINQGEAMIDTLLLSCRILGKNIEDAFVRYTLSLLKSEGIRTVNAVYSPTVKNIQVRNFYDKIGFGFIEDRGGDCYYSGDLDNLDLSISEIYKLKNDER